VISDVTTTTAASGVVLFVIMALITIHFGWNPRNGGSPPKDNSDVNIMKFISVVDRDSEEKPRRFARNCDLLH